MGEITPAMKLAIIDRKSFVKEKRKLVLNERKEKDSMGFVDRHSRVQIITFLLTGYVTWRVFILFAMKCLYL